MGGHFLEVNGNSSGSGVAVYNGSTWSNLNGGVNDYVRALTKYNGNIIVGGNFSTAGSVNANKIAKWNPSTGAWTAMGSGMNDYVKALDVYNGSLYAGGPFTSAGGNSINGVAKWTESIGAAPSSSFNISSSNICAGQCITLSDNSSGNPTSWTWTFTGANISSSSSQNPGQVCFSNPGTYSIKLKVCNSSGCDSVSQNINSTNASISASSATTICTGASTALNATGGASYSWSPSTGLSCTSCASPVASPASTTTYTVQGTNANGCSNTATTTVTVSQAPVANAGSDAAICNGETKVLTATGGSSYNWSPAASLSCSTCPSPVASPASTTAYTVTVTNASGCTDTDVINLTVASAPVANAGSDASICGGETKVLTATGGASYSWSPAASLSCYTCPSPVASPSSTTAYTVTVTNASGCTDTDVINLTVASAPVANAGSDASICGGETKVLTASGGTSYSWSPAASLSCSTCPSPTAGPASTTTYTVTVTNAVGCADMDEVTLIVNPAPVANAGGDVSICNGESASLQATGGNTYSWSPAFPLSCSACSSPVVNASATTTFTVIVTDANGCTDTDVVDVVVNSLPVANAGSDVSLCKGESAHLLATGGNTYSWSPSADLSCSGCQAPIASPMVTSSYMVTVTDANNCSSISTVTITVNDLPVVSVTQDTSICEGASVLLSCVGATDYLWNSSPDLNCLNCASTLATPSVSALYSVTGTDMNGCMDSAQVNVIVLVAPVAYAGIDDTICTGESLMLNGTGGGTYLWSPPAGLSCTTCPGPVASPVSTTEYTLVVTGSNGCTGTHSVDITVEVCMGMYEQVTDVPVEINFDSREDLLSLQSDISIERVEVHAVNGQLITTYNDGSNRIQLDTSHLTAGIYVLRIFTEDSKVHSGKFRILE